MRIFRKAELVLAVVRAWGDAEIEKELADAYPDLTQQDLKIIAQYGFPQFPFAARYSRGDGVASRFFRRAYRVAAPVV